MVKVAIVEDHLDYGLILRDMINSAAGFEVVNNYASAEEALRAKDLAGIGIIMVDIRLPGISGIELIRKLKPQQPDTQFMVCSTHDDNESVFQALKAGATGYLLKDSDPGQIIAALTELAQGGSPMSPFIARKVVAAFHEPAKPSNQVLSDREIEIMNLVMAGLLYSAIGDKLFIATETVKTHIRNIYRKLHVKNKVSAIIKFKEL